MKTIDQLRERIANPYNYGLDVPNSFNEIISYLRDVEGKDVSNITVYTPSLLGTIKAALLKDYSCMRYCLEYMISWKDANPIRERIKTLVFLSQILPDENRQVLQQTINTLPIDKIS